MAATPIQSVGAASGSTTNPQTAVFPQNVRVGTTLWLLSMSSVSSEAITGITDTRGNTYTEIVDTIVDATRFELWEAPSGGAGANTVSVTYSAVTSASKRVWAIEIGDLGSWTLGPVDTVNASSSADPLNLATQTITAEGLSFQCVRGDTTFTFSAWEDPSAGNFGWVDLGGGTTSRASMRAVGLSTPALAPRMNVTTAFSGDAIAIAIYAGVSGGIPGSRIFTGF